MEKILNFCRHLTTQKIKTSVAFEGPLNRPIKFNIIFASLAWKIFVSSTRDFRKIAEAKSENLGKSRLSFFFTSLITKMAENQAIIIINGNFFFGPLPFVVA